MSTPLPAHLHGMTQARWDAYTPYERECLRDNSGLTTQLHGLEGWRVEAVEYAGDTPRRFIVGVSAGWRPCHIELATRRSSGGISAAKSYHSVRRIERVR